ncbi:hypothetical protein [Ureibacillus sinduriensis]|nr:hypothetical protein [Ureibacillus sinduriensis]
MESSRRSMTARRMKKCRSRNSSEMSFREEAPKDGRPSNGLNYLSV